MGGCRAAQGIRAPAALPPHLNLIARIHARWLTIVTLAPGNPMHLHSQVHTHIQIYTPADSNLKGMACGVYDSGRQT